MNDKILTSYELLCTELESVISALEIASSDIEPDKALALVEVTTNGLKHLTKEHISRTDRLFKEYSNG